MEPARGVGPVGSSDRQPDGFGDADMEQGMTRRAALRVAAVGLAALVLPGCKGPATRREGAKTMANSEWDISVCGLNCATCGERLEKQCGGCHGPTEKCWSPDCKLRLCAAAKGHGYCFECGEFSCEKLQAFATDGWKHHAQAVANLKRMREIGLERWIAEQPKAVPGPGGRS